MTGKMFSVEWIGGLQRRAVAAGGTDEDGTAIYEAFHANLSNFNKQQNTKKSAGTGLSAARNSKMIQARFEARKKFAQTFQAADDGCVVMLSSKPTNAASAVKPAQDTAASDSANGEAIVKEGLPSLEVITDATSPIEVRTVRKIVIEL